MAARTGPLVRPLTLDDVDWAVAVLAERRDRLRPHAPRYWARAQDATERHREYLAGVIEAGALGYRTERSLLVAAPRKGRWEVDDAAVTNWGTDGLLLWAALSEAARGERVRIVCPTPEYDRLMFARFRGLALAESWWHLEIEPSGPATPERVATVGDALADVLTAPPVYAPGGPLLFLRDPSVDALGEAPERGAALGCVLVVASQTTPQAGDRLEEAGYTHHADFCEGILT